jgi:hypothetical protein
MDDTGRAFDHWVRGMGGFTGERYQALYREAFEFAGADGLMPYLEMARQLDEDHAGWKRQREARTRAQAASRAADAAAAATLRRVNDIKLAVDSLASDPRLAGDPDFGAQAPMGRAEVDLELRAAMGLAARAPSAYEQMLPPVADLARVIGVRS